MVASITRWQGYTGGVSRIVSRVAGSLRKHRSAIHEARPAGRNTSGQLLSDALYSRTLTLPLRRCTEM